MGPLVERFESEFEQVYGYEAEGNRVEPVRDGPVGALDDLPVDLVEFYTAVREVQLPDLNNGYFIHPVDFVLNSREHGTPMYAPEIVDGRIYVFGSDGGGGLFAIPSSGSPVYLLSSGPVNENVYQSMGAPPEEVSKDIEGFLYFLESTLKRVVDEYY